MYEQYLIIGSAIALALVITIIVLHIVRKAENRYFKNRIKDLEIQRNMIASTPVLVELSKVESITKNNDLMEEKCNKWQDRFTVIKEKRLSSVDDMLIELDTFLDDRDYKSCGARIAKVELEIYKIREAANKLLGEVREVSTSENKFRENVTKLKSRYRAINQAFKHHLDSYGEMAEPVELQLENIENRFVDFEMVMERTEYSEAVKLVSALTTMIDHIEIVVRELPDIMRLANKTLPDTMNEIEEIYNEMLEEKYSLDYLNIEYNIKESKKTIDNIMSNVKKLNLENAKADLDGILSFFQSLFIDFEKERLSKKVYLDELDPFTEKLNKVNTQVNSVFESLDKLKSTYNLREQDIIDIEDANKLLVVINDDYRKMTLKDSTRVAPYTLLYEELENLSARLNSVDDDFNITLNSLGNMYDDEERAKEQLVEIEEFLEKSKKIIHSYKLPVITEEYFIQLEESTDSIREVKNELEKKPIEIMTLNTRVDTARDLVLKLYNTTNEMIKMAKMAEASIVYGNRYRSFYKEVDRGLKTAEDKFFSGNYKLAFDTTVKSLQLVDKNIKEKLKNIYSE